MDRTIAVGDKWRHFKGGEYQILGVSTTEATIGSFVSFWGRYEPTNEIIGIYDLPRGMTVVKADGVTVIEEQLVVYCQPGGSQVWGRPIANFLEVLGDRTTHYYRFEKMV